MTSLLSSALSTLLKYVTLKDREDPVSRFKPNFVLLGYSKKPNSWSAFYSQLKYFLKRFDRTLEIKCFALLDYRNIYISNVSAE